VLFRAILAQTSEFCRALHPLKTPKCHLLLPHPFDFDHQLGDEIPTKHKEAIRQLHWFAKTLIGQLDRVISLANRQFVVFYSTMCPRKLALACAKAKHNPHKSGANTYSPHVTNIKPPDFYKAFLYKITASLMSNYFL
jgi:hypothetical protein